MRRLVNWTNFIMVLAIGLLLTFAMRLEPAPTCDPGEFYLDGSCWERQ